MRWGKRESFSLLLRATVTTRLAVVVWQQHGERDVTYLSDATSRVPDVPWNSAEKKSRIAPPRFFVFVADNRDGGEGADFSAVGIGLMRWVRLRSVEASISDPSFSLFMYVVRRAREEARESREERSWVNPVPSALLSRMTNTCAFRKKLRLKKEVKNSRAEFGWRVEKNNKGNFLIGSRKKFWLIVVSFHSSNPEVLSWINE